MTIASQTSSPVPAEAIRVLVVDDSVVVRGFLTRFVESDPAIKVISSVSNGEMAVNSVQNKSFDVVILDIEMPVMDGITALPLILKADPNVQVIIASTLSKENAAITLKAFEIGAAECLAKPTTQDLANASVFRDNLVEKVKTLGQLAQRKRGTPRNVAAPVSAPAPLPASSSPTASVATAAQAARKFTLRAETVKTRPDIIAIGSSTGGPQALLNFFLGLKGGIKQPILVTQHMPPTFTALLAEQISKQTGLKCKEGEEGEVVQGGCIYIAPGNFHMTIKSVNGKDVIALNQDPPESFCRPAVDPMLRSITKIHGKKALAIILTGMGSDGTKSCQGLVEAGGTVLAQDEATSVVWGMPGSAAMAGVCTQVLPLGLLPGALKEYTNQGALT